MEVADLFCGAGGTSTGAILAAREMGIELSLLAVNHWPVAVATHAANHPWARHLCADLSSVDPSKAVPSGKLDLLVASPECTHHSNARGDKPCSDQSRASAFHVLHWMERLNVSNLLMENVREFEDWGPLLDRPITLKGKKYRKGRPDPRKRGVNFKALVGMMEGMGYTVEWRIMNAADYGEATTRQRLFIQATKHGKPTWPKATHAGHWRPARDVIDWSITGRSIFNRNRPLAPRTMDRIEAGLRKFGGTPFIAILKGRSSVRDVESPLPTMTAGVAHLAIAEPFLILMEHSGRQPERSCEYPLPTITTAKGGSFGLCEPFITKYYGTAQKPISVSEPLATITAKDRMALVIPQGMDIRFRMLKPHELGKAMGFDGYTFTGNQTEQVRQIGNAVSVKMAKALCLEIFRSMN